MKKVLEGTHAGAQGVILARAQVIAAYPITPQTTTVERLAEACANGEVDAEYIPVESEHSAMAACIGAAAVGARTFTATSSQGLALMHELLFWATGARLPIVMLNANRGMAAPWNSWLEHTDSLAQRDTGWMQFYCASNQEVLDTILQAYWVAEKVMLPCMVNLDGFVLTHTCEPVDIPDQDLVDQYLPPYRPRYKIDINDPHSYGASTNAGYLMEMRYITQQAMEEVPAVMKACFEEFERVFRRRYDFFEEHFCSDAETVLVAMGTAADTARVVVDNLRAVGRRVGLLRLRVFRPFPVEMLRAKLGRARRVVVMDRDISFGCGGIVAEELRAALCPLVVRPTVFSFVTGLGGRDVTPEHITRMVTMAEELPEPPGELMWMGVKL